MNLPVADYSVLTPYRVPPDLNKVVNTGDGFILDSCEKLIGARAGAYFPLRGELSDADIERINAGKLLLVAGSNILTDEFFLCRGLTAENLQRIKVPVAMMGIGHSGMPHHNKAMQEPSVKLMTALLERFPYISLRCNASHMYFTGTLPPLKDKALMTACPVAYAVDGIDNKFTRPREFERIVVTITDRMSSEVRPQIKILEYAGTLFRSRSKVLALHQDYKRDNVKAFARHVGFEVFDSPRYENCLELYKGADLHIGNRLHGHLKMLSLGNASFLMPYDLRQTCFAQTLDFPIIQSFPSPEAKSYDFNRFTARRKTYEPVMQRFVGEVRKLLPETFAQSKAG